MPVFYLRKGGNGGSGLDKGSFFGEEAIGRAVQYIMSRGDFKPDDGVFRGPDNCSVAFAPGRYQVQTEYLSPEVLKDLVDILQPGCYIDGTCMTGKVIPISELPI